MVSGPRTASTLSISNFTFFSMSSAMRLALERRLEPRDLPHGGLAHPSCARGQASRCRSDMPLTTTAEGSRTSLNRTAAAGVGHRWPAPYAFLSYDAKLKRVVGERRPA